MIRLIALALIAFSFSFCSKNDSPPSVSYLSVKIDGVARETKNVYAVMETQKSNYLTFVAHLSPTENISFSLNNGRVGVFSYASQMAIGYEKNNQPLATPVSPETILEITSIGKTIKGNFEFRQFENHFTEGKFECRLEYR